MKLNDDYSCDTRFKCFQTIFIHTYSTRELVTLNSFTRLIVFLVFCKLELIFLQTLYVVTYIHTLCYFHFAHHSLFTTISQHYLGKRGREKIPANINTRWLRTNPSTINRTTTPIEEDALFSL